VLVELLLEPPSHSVLVPPKAFAPSDVSEISVPDIAGAVVTGVSAASWTVAVSNGDVVTI